jgi:hypothetical protein
LNLSSSKVGYLSKSAALTELPITPQAFQAAARLMKKGRLAYPRRGFYLILRPEDRLLGAPETAQWIHPLMTHLGLDYRISLLRGGRLSRVVPPGVDDLPGYRSATACRHRDWAPAGRVSQSGSRQLRRSKPAGWLVQLKTEAGFAKVAGIELALLDMCRYLHHAAGISGAAQAVHDLGKRADPRTLAAPAAAYGNSAVRRFGYLLERIGHDCQANALRGFVERAKAFTTVTPLRGAVGLLNPRDAVPHDAR